MAKYININDTIDGEHTDGNTRKFEWKGLKRHPITNKLMTLYECDRNSFAEIVKEFKGEPERGTESFHRLLGDSLEADAISIYIDTKRKVKYDVTNLTARHKAQAFKIRNRSISTIKMPLENLRRYILSVTGSNTESKSIENL